MTRPEWRKVLAEKIPHWSVRIDQHRTRARPSRMSADRLLELHQAAQDRCGDARATSTWQGIASVVNQFEHFDLMADNRSYSILPLEHRMMIFIEHKLQVNEIDVSSAVIYYRKLHQLYRLICGGEGLMLKEYGLSLTRNPASVPVGDRPLEPAEMTTVLRQALNDVQWCQFKVQWLTASRCNDLNRLQRSDIRFDQGHLVVEWQRGTKSGVDKRVDFIPDPPPRLVRYLRSLRPSAQPFPLQAATTTRLVRRFLRLPPSESPKVGSHSIKKGALVALLKQGVPLTYVAFKAKHSSLENLQTYVGAEMWARAHDAAELSARLDRTIM